MKRSPDKPIIAVSAAPDSRPTSALPSVAALCLMLLAFLLLLSACAPAGEAEGSAANHRLRITNQSEIPLTGLVVLFPEDRIEFPDIPAGATSEYQAVPNGVYNYAAFELEIDGETYNQPVIDWVGESPREGDDFTYVLSVDPTRQGGDLLVIELVEVQDD